MAAERCWFDSTLNIIIFIEAKKIILIEANIINVSKDLSKN